MLPVSITPQAVAEIKQIIASKQVPEGYGLRLLVEGGSGCGGARYRLGFDRPKPEDVVFVWEGLEVMYQKQQLLFLVGMELAFEEREHERGFVFRKRSNS
ncbi:MAG: HesB/IscA family protein [Bernardetiaceae bacterium]